MAWCPVTKSDCLDECAWFRQGECAFQRLHDVADKIEEIVDIVDCLDSLEKTIKNKEF